jgi:hypothetical protein
MKDTKLTSLDRLGMPKLPPLPRKSRGVWQGQAAVGGWLIRDDNGADGKCGRCGQIREAIRLELYRHPFGRGEWWQCKDGCTVR